jgi:hypothetical protein
MSPWRKSNEPPQEAVGGRGSKTEAIALRPIKQRTFWTEAAQKTKELVVGFEHFLTNFIYMNVSAVAIDVEGL